ncbi:MAG: hypothetical protein IJQ60_17350, partial [Prevotella sp.]|nr:hypothetical protein [Prevotella sp.]
MKHFYSKLKLFLVALFALVGTGAWAIDVKIADTSSGLPQAAGFGTFSGQVFTTADGSGLAGVTVTAESGVTIGEQVVNVANYGNCFKLVTAAAATDYRITLAAPAGYFIKSYSLQCSANTKNAVHTLTSEDAAVSVVASAPVYNTPTGPKPFVVDGLNAQTTYFTISTANQGNTLYLPSFIIQVYPEGTKFVNVTYELYESDGTTPIGSEVIEQVANSAIEVPSSLMTGFYYDFATEGSIGETDCTIKVIRTFKAGIVSDIANLSNSKAYKLTTARGSLGTNGVQMVSTNGTTYSASNFALLNYKDNYYLYSIADSKFVGNPTTINEVQNQPALTDDLSNVTPVSFSLTSAPLYYMGMGSYGVNVSNYATGIVVNTWTTRDAGNQYVIEEAGDFDSKDAMAAIYEYFRLFADGKYYINNVGTGKYLAAGANWGTHAVVNADGLDYDIKMAEGKYTLDSQVSNGGVKNFLNGEWNDGVAFGWTFNEVSEGVYTISDGTNFLTAGENGVVTLAADATVDAAKWTLKTLEDRIAELAAATAEAPVDATFLIQNANFGRNDLRKSAWTMDASNQNLSGGEDNNGSVGNNCAESFHSTFTLSQALTNAPAGKYKMTAQGFYRQDDGAIEDLPVFYANDKTANFPAKTGS